MRKAKPNRCAVTIAASLLLLWANAASGQAFNSGSTGADGILTHNSGVLNVNTRAGGIYHYQTVNINGGTYRFIKSPDNSPVVILATGDVTIAAGASLSVNGLDTQFASNTSQPWGGALGGPGGFDGGNAGFPAGSAQFPAGVLPNAGHGPGGGAPASGAAGQNAQYGAPNAFPLIPLVGGSGGGGGAGFFFGGGPNSGTAGSGGGGAILIASNTRIIVNGAIRANGGLSPASACNSTITGGVGSGGAIRLVAPQIIGNGVVQAIGGTGGCQTPPAFEGRIRFEALPPIGFVGQTQPTPFVANAPGPVFATSTPALVNVPTLAVASIGGVPTPASPIASYGSPDISLAPGTPNPVPVVINATNTPVGAPTEIRVRLLPPGGLSTVAVPVAEHSGTFASSTATANVNLPAGQVTVIQAFATMTLTGQTASLFPLIDGEPVVSVAMAANVGEASTLSLVTKSGKERRVDQLPAEDQTRVALAWEVMRALRSE